MIKDIFLYPSTFTENVISDGRSFIKTENKSFDLSDWISEAISNGLISGAFSGGSGSGGSVWTGTPITTIARNLLPNTAGSLIYNSTTTQYEFNNGSAWKAVGAESLLSHDTTLSHETGDQRIYRSITVQANAAIPANTAFNWGATGATWKPIIPVGYTWNGIWLVGTTYAINSVVATSVSSNELYSSTIITTGDDPASIGNPAWSDYKFIDFDIFSGANATFAGRKGLVPQPALGQTDAILKSDGSWAAPTLGTLLVSNKATGGDLHSTATTTPDYIDRYVVTQTTASQTMTLGNPSVTYNRGRLVYVQNASASTASFTVYGKALTADKFVALYWTGTTWSPLESDQSDAVQSLTATGSATKWGSIVLVNSATTTVITLPIVTTSDIGKKITVKNIGVGVNTQTSADTVQGATTLNQFESITFEATALATVHVVSDRLFYNTSTWAAVTVYSANNLVKLNGVVYQRISNGTSGATFDITEAANWTVVSIDSTTNAYVALTYYPIGQQVSTGSRIVERTVAGLSGATFTNAEAANWKLVSQTSFQSTWTASTYYFQGENVLFNGRTLQKLISGITGATFDVTEAALWTPVTGLRSGSAWVASTYYYAGDIVEYSIDGVVIKKIASGMSTATYNNAEKPLWTLVSSTKTNAWTAATYYYIGQSVVHANKRLQQLVGAISQTAFNVTESANWTLLDIQPAIWTANTLYYAGETVESTVEGIFIKRIATGVSLGIFSNAEKALWAIVSSNYINTWVASTYYYIGAEIVYANKTLKQITGQISAATFTSLESAVWSVIDSKLSQWLTATYYYAGELVSNNGVVYQKIAGSVSTATFDSAEELLWNRIGTLDVNPKTITAATYTVLATDSILSIDATTNAINITFPSTLPSGKFYTIQYAQTANSITFTAGAGTTIVSPITYTAGASFIGGGSVGQYGTTQIFKVGTVWNFLG